MGFTWDYLIWVYEAARYDGPSGRYPSMIGIAFPNGRIGSSSCLLSLAGLLAASSRRALMSKTIWMYSIECYWSLTIDFFWLSDQCLLESDRLTWCCYEFSASHRILFPFFRTYQCLAYFRDGKFFTKARVNLPPAELDKARPWEVLLDFTRLSLDFLRYISRFIWRLISGFVQLPKGSECLWVIDGRA